MLSRNGFTLIVSGPSGVGKSSICRSILERDAGIGFCVTTTTRPRRQDEVEGQDRFFVSETEFREGIGQGAFAEWATIYGHLYGTTWQALRTAQGRHDVVILDLDVQGAEHWKRRLREGCVAVFVLPPSLHTLRRRLIARGTDEGPDLDRRMENARQEMTHIGSYDYLIFNDRVENAVGSLLAVVGAERQRSFRYQGDILKDLERQ